MKTKSQKATFLRDIRAAVNRNEPSKTAIKEAIEYLESVLSKNRTKNFDAMTYDEYLRTPHWREVRKIIISKRGGKCESCGTTENLQAHHDIYMKRGQELDYVEFFTILCLTCHENKHGRTFNRQ